MAKRPRLATGARFRAVVKSARGARNPYAVAASAGIKKYGKKRMQSMAKAGKRRRKRSRR